MSLPIVSRRGFFAALGKAAFVSTSAVPFAHSAIAALHDQISLATVQKHLHVNTYVAGIYYYQANQIRHLLSSGNKLVLRRQPSNPHDTSAIEVFATDNIKLGYVPAAVNQPYADLMDQGQEVLAIITGIEAGPHDDIDIRLSPGPAGFHRLSILSHHEPKQIRDSPLTSVN